MSNAVYQRLCAVGRCLHYAQPDKATCKSCEEAMSKGLDLNDRHLQKKVSVRAKKLTTYEARVANAYADSVRRAAAVAQAQQIQEEVQDVDFSE